MWDDQIQIRNWSITRIECQVIFRPDIVHTDTMLCITGDYRCRRQR